VRLSFPPSGCFGKATRTEYLCHVGFGNFRDDLQSVKNWLQVSEHDSQAYALLCPENYARAVVGNYFRLRPCSEIRFEKFIPRDPPPSGEPTLDTEKYKLWVSSLSEKEIETAESVALTLSQECRSRGGKISVREARAIFYEKMKDGGFLWEDVLYEFSKQGGAHTDKYLRLKAW
jgi:hypothetical protein